MDPSGPRAPAPAASLKSHSALASRSFGHPAVSNLDTLDEPKFFETQEKLLDVRDELRINRTALLRCQQTGSGLGIRWLDENASQQQSRAFVDEVRFPGRDMVKGGVLTPDDPDALVGGDGAISRLQEFWSR